MQKNSSRINATIQVHDQQRTHHPGCSAGGAAEVQPRALSHQHALTVEGVMRWYAQELGYGEEADFWATVGLLHDIDFEQWPGSTVRKRRLLREAAAAMI